MNTINATVTIHREKKTKKKKMNELRKTES